jgi:hypothetical protein
MRLRLGSGLRLVTHAGKVERSLPLVKNRHRQECGDYSSLS